MPEDANHPESEEENELIDRSWKKLERDLHKEGYREGAVKGQEESFQLGFDTGFAEGYKIGEAMGIYKGMTSILKQVNKLTDENDCMRLVLASNEGNRACILCETDDMESLSLDSVITEQRMRNSEIIKGFTPNG